MIGSIRDTLNLSRKLTLRRTGNAIKIAGSYYHARLTKKPALSGMPISISFEPTTSCNLRCPECPSGLRSFTRPTGMLSEELFRDTIDQLAGELTYLTFYFQGEPFLHPDFLRMVRYAGDRGIYTATSTNGHYLDPDQAEATVASGLDRLIVSVDGMTQETYAAYRRGGRLERVLEGIRNVVEMKKKLNSATPHLVAQFLVVKPNEHEVPLVMKMKRDFGVDQVVLKTAQIYNYEHGSPLLPVNERLSRYRKTHDDTYEIKNSLSDRCWRMWHSCVITWDGRIVPCCFDKDAHHVMGDLRHESFHNIWHGSRYEDFRRTLFESRSAIEMCRNCTEGTR